MKIAELLTVAGRQHGCFTYQQALRLISKHQLHDLVDKGIVRREWPGTYAVVGTINSWLQRAHSVVLSADGAALSHRSAAKLLGMSFGASEHIEITVPRGTCRRRDEVTVHRSQQLEGYVTEVEGIRVTSAARTLVDISSQTTPRQLGAIVDQACNLKLIRLVEIEHCLDQMVTIGRSRVSNMREVLAQRSITDENLDSFVERRVLSWIRAHGLPEPQSQYWVIANGSRYRHDFAYVDHRIDIEPDGPHHLLPSVAAYDRRRDTDVTLAGWIVLRVSIDTPEQEFISRLRTALTIRSKASPAA